MHDTPIRLDRADDGIATLTLCRPAEKNLVTREWVAALHAHVLALRDDREARCVLLRAEGTMFCAGADVKDMLAHLDDLPSHIDALITPAHEAFAALYGLPMPLVGCLEGTAAGGGASLALACDFLVAEPAARLVFAYPQLATTPDCGLSYALSQRLGATRALQVYLGRDALSAIEAHALGLVTEVAPQGQAWAAAQALARRLAGLPGDAARSAKRLFLGGGAQALQSALDAERASFLRCAATPAFRDRVAAFGARHG